MLRTRTITVGALAAVVIGVSIAVLCGRSPNEDTSGPEHTPEVASEIVIEDDPSVRMKIEEFGLGFRSNGTMTYLGSDYSEDTPLIEISPQIRRLDGSIESLKVADLSLRRDGWSHSYGVEGTTLRLQLGSVQTGGETLLFGREYAVAGMFPVGGHSEYEFSGNTRGGKFRIPDEVGRGKICRVKVVVIDEILEKELLAKKEAAKKEGAGKSNGNADP